MPRRGRRLAVSQDKQAKSTIRTEKPEQMRFRLHWEGVEALPVLWANQIFVRLEDEEQVLITFGQATLPHEVQLSPDSIQRLKTAGLPVRAVARLAVTPRRLEEMMAHLNTIRAVWRQRRLPSSLRAPTEEVRNG